MLKAPGGLEHRPLWQAVRSRVVRTSQSRGRSVSRLPAERKEGSDALGRPRQGAQQDRRDHDTWHLHGLL